MMTFVRASSLRVRAPQETLVIASQLAQQMGISRIMDISGLDRLQLPVFACINPTLHTNQVTYGKGLNALDSQIGAYMESIEFKIAQPDYLSQIMKHWGTLEDISPTRRNQNSRLNGTPDNVTAQQIVLDFCPLLHTKIATQKPIMLAQVEDVSSLSPTEMESGTKSPCPALIPAELVFFPLRHAGQRIFGSGTNGLASGNTVLEASVHALYELIERDICSFQYVCSSQIKVDVHSLPQRLQSHLTPLRQAGFELSLHYAENPYDVAYFVAHLWHPDAICDKFFNAGWGCHSDKQIAATRAICEAAQSHTAVLHGARKFTQSTDFSAPLAEEIAKHHASHLPTVAFHSLPTSPHSSLQKQWQTLTDKIMAVTGNTVFRAVFTPPDFPIQVVRIVAPGLEYFQPQRMRVGHRLKAVLEGPLERQTDNPSGRPI